MRAVVMHEPGNVTVEETPMPTILEPTDAIIKLAATCICGSDLWPYRGAQPVHEQRMGHEYVGTVVEVGSAVTTVRPGDFVVGSFCISCGECLICRTGYPSRCATAAARRRLRRHARRRHTGRVRPHRLADGTLVKTPGMPTREHDPPHSLAASDVLGTGWFAADEAGAGPGSTIVVVGDGAVGLGAIIGARQLGASRIIAMSRHANRQALACEFGATDIVEERGEEGIARVKALTGGLGADGVVEAVGNEASFDQALGCVRPGGHLSFVGVPHGVSLDMSRMFDAEVHMFGGPAPVRKYLPTLINLIIRDVINPGAVFDMVLPLDRAAEGYAAMDDRRATKVLLTI